MNPITNCKTDVQPAIGLSPKLRAALDYLGDKLCTHPASRFKPAKSSLLDQWLALRHGTLSGCVSRPKTGYRSWVTNVELMPTPSVSQPRRARLATS